jgi:hypothetical protein
VSAPAFHSALPSSRFGASRNKTDFAPRTLTFRQDFSEAIMYFRRRHLGLACSMLFSTVHAATIKNDGVESSLTRESAQEELYRWKVAATHADAAYLEQLLTSDYTDVSKSGAVLDRSAIIESTRKRSRNTDPVERSRNQVVQLQGVLASVHSLVSDTIDGAPVKVLYTDDLIFEGGRWRAFYSQQSVFPNSDTVPELSPVSTEEQAESVTGCEPQPDVDDVGESLKQLRHAWLAAEIRGNAGFLTCLLSPAYQETNYRGSSRGREALIRYSAKRADANKPIPAAVEQVALVHGDAAVVRNLWSGEIGGRPTKMWLADTFAKVNGVWRVIYTQQSAIPSP